MSTLGVVVWNKYFSLNLARWANSIKLLEYLEFLNNQSLAIRFIFRYQNGSSLTKLILTYLSSNCNHQGQFIGITEIKCKFFKGFGPKLSGNLDCGEKISISCVIFQYFSIWFWQNIRRIQTSMAIAMLIGLFKILFEDTCLIWLDFYPKLVRWC